MPIRGLVLSGGGARGAYQAGVLAAVAQICEKGRIQHPFQIYTGVSAGAINVGLLVATPNDFIESAKNLVGLWSHIQSDQVFYADLMALSRGGLQWMTEVSLGGKKSAPLKSLLSTHPLQSFLSHQCHFEEIDKKIQSGVLRSVGVSALDYDSVSTVTFYRGHEDVKSWERGLHRATRAELGVEHILASSAIPMLFPPIAIGDGFYGDGCIRNQSPCGPAIYMGADKLLAIGVRRKQDTWFTYHHPREKREVPSVARVANVLMNAVMMDGVESDIQRIEQINQSYGLLTENEKSRIALREVESLWIAPSVDFADLADHKTEELPRIIRYLLRGPGSLEESREMLSYLLFTPSYCRQLVDIGFSDAMKQKDAIEKWLGLGELENIVQHHPLTH